MKKEVNFVCTFNMRPCSVDGEKALFHRWEDKSWIVPASPLVGGHSGGEVRGVFAIVEMEDGSIREVEPTQVNFGDNHRLFEQYAFGMFESEEQSQTPCADVFEKEASLLMWEVVKTVSKWRTLMECTCPACKKVYDTTEEPPAVCPFCNTKLDGYFVADQPESSTIFPTSRVYQKW